MPCFGGVFRHWLRGLGGLGDSRGTVYPFERISDCPAMGFLRQADMSAQLATGFVNQKHL